MATSLFVNKLVEDYVETGLAESPEPGVLTGLDGEGRVELELGEDRKSLDVYVAGDHAGSVAYDSETFAADLLALVHDELGL